MTATFTKLRDDSWGLRVRGSVPEPGQTVLVTKKSGDSEYLVVGRIVAKFDDATLVTIDRDADPEIPGVETHDGEITNPYKGRFYEVLDWPATSEMEDAVALVLSGRSIAIEAGAGTGKTSTLIRVALALDALGKRGQYVAFNNSIVDDSSKKFPPSVACNTAHSLAVRTLGAPFWPRQKSGARMKSHEIAKILRTEPITVTNWNDEKKTLSATFLAGHVMNAVRRFCQSADPEPTYRHFPRIDNLDSPPVAERPTSYAINDDVARQLVPVLKRAWADLCLFEGKLPFTLSTMMAVVLKLYQLSEPKLAADYVLFDEAQDASPVMVDIIRQQTHAQIIWVGDSNQQIYGFTGAINALANVPAEDRSMLRQSFRFGETVAEVANRVLSELPTEMRLIGTPEIPSVVGFVDAPDAILSRTNATAIRAVMEAIGSGRKPHLVGGGGEIAGFCRAARDLQDGIRTDHVELACFESWGEVQEYVAEDEQGGDLRLMVKLIDEFGVDEILAAVNGCSKEEHADLIVSTAHKSKGRQWKRVKLGADFPEAAKMGDEEKRLLYVAVTRAQIALDITAVEFFEPPSTEEEETDA